MNRYRVARSVRIDGRDRLVGEVLTLDYAFAAPLVADGRLLLLDGSPGGYRDRMLSATPPDGRCWWR